MAGQETINKAAREIDASAKMWMGMSFKQLANIFKSIAGSSFMMDEFIRTVGSIQINRIGATLDSGASTNNIVRVATAGVWNEAAFQIAAPSDRFRIVLNFKLTLYTLLNADDAVGEVVVPEGATQQLISLGQMDMNRSRGRSVESRTWQFLTGADNSRFQGQALAAGAQAADAAIAQPRMPSELQICPWGLRTHLDLALDAINPQDRMSVRMSGLNSLAVADGYAEDLGLGVDVLVIDAVKSGI